MRKFERTTSERYEASPAPATTQEVNLNDYVRRAADPSFHHSNVPAEEKEEQ